MHRLPNLCESAEDTSAHPAVLCHQTGCLQSTCRAITTAPLGLPHEAVWLSLACFSPGAPTMLVSRIDICSKVQEALQAGQALWLLAGQVQGAALMDLSRESTARLAPGPVSGSGPQPPLL